MVSPRKSRKKSACFSSTITSTPARASRKPAITPAGPPPTIAQVQLRDSAMVIPVVPGVARLPGQRARHQQLLDPDRQRAHARSGRMIDRVGDGRRGSDIGELAETFDAG